MKLNESSIRLKEVIEKAIADLKITQKEYEQILEVATEDGKIDHQERVLLSQLQELIARKVVVLSP